jgi:hypothetical protein
MISWRSRSTTRSTQHASRPSNLSGVGRVITPDLVPPARLRRTGGTSRFARARQKSSKIRVTPRHPRSVDGMFRRLPGERKTQGHGIGHAGLPRRGTAPMTNDVQSREDALGDVLDAVERALASLPADDEYRPALLRLRRGLRVVLERAAGRGPRLRAVPPLSQASQELQESG